MTTLDLQSLAELAAQSTIDKIKESDAFDVVATQLAEAWKKEEPLVEAAARAGRRRYQFDFKSTCSASREEMIKLMPESLAAMNPWVWYSAEHDDVYEFSFSWETQCQKIVEKFEAEQRESRKRKLEEEEAAAAEKKSYKQVPRVESPTAQVEGAPQFFIRRASHARTNWKDQHVIFAISEKRNLAHCLAHDGDSVQIQMISHVPGKMMVLDLPVTSVLGLANLTKVYVTFDHCHKTITARVIADGGGEKVRVAWYDHALKSVCEMELARTRLIMHANQEAAFTEDRKACDSVVA